ncbi:hypothetical protein QOT17_25637 [Balamuthia mandrillaris]
MICFCAEHITYKLPSYWGVFLCYPYHATLHSLSQRRSLKITTQRKRCVEAAGKASVQVRETLLLKSAASQNPFSSHPCILRHKDSEDKACLGELRSGPGFIDSQERQKQCLPLSSLPQPSLCSAGQTFPILKPTLRAAAWKKRRQATGHSWFVADLCTVFLPLFLLPLLPLF